MLGRWRQEDYGFEVILGYMASMRLIWTTGDPILKNFFKKLEVQVCEGWKTYSNLSESGSSYVGLEVSIY